MHTFIDEYRLGAMVKANVPIRCSYEWKDKAGGYGIQTAFGAIAVKRIEGDYYNVIGLPIGLLYQMLKKLYHND